MTEISNTSFAHSAGAAIYRGWRAADVDLRPTNTFADIAGCLETDVPDASNACPAAACPSL
jgi:hypothetical protein